MTQRVIGNNDGRIALKDSDNNPVSANFPLNVDGDSVYSKDVNESKSSPGTFVGSVLSLFNDYETEIVDVGATNPKVITVHLLRPVKTNQIGIGSLTGDFSNVKISLKDLSGTVRQVVDDSADSTKYTSNVYSFTVSVFIEAVIEFHTADPVKISGMYIPKVQSRAISAIDGYVSETNTTEITLAPGGVFTGGQVDTLNYGMALVAVYSDVASATDGLNIQFRSTPTGTWRSADDYTIVAMKEKTFSVQTVRRFMRIVYTNGGTIQAVFDLQTVLKPVYVKPSSHRVADFISGQDDAELVKANLTGERPDGAYGNVAVTNGNNLKVSLEEWDAALLDDPLPVHVIDVHSVIVNEHFRLDSGTSELLTAPASAGDSLITVANGATFTVNDRIVLTDPGTGLHETDVYKVLVIATNDLTIDKPLENNLAVGSVAETTEIDMATSIGTIAVPNIFKIAPPAGEVWHIKRIIIAIADDTAMDDGKFGGIPALTNGVVVRVVNGEIKNPSVWRSNGDMAEDMFDITYTSKAPAGENGLRGRWSFDKAGVAFKLDGDLGHYMAMICQDVLTAITEFEIKAQGHIVGK